MPSTLCHPEAKPKDPKRSEGPLAQRAALPAIEALDAYWRAANYLGAAQLYLQDNVLLREPLRPSHLKPRPLGHWGTQPGLNLIYAHLNRFVRDTQANVLLVVGPGHGAAAILANLYLEETLAQSDPRLDYSPAGLTEFVKRFSWPGGAPSHLTAQTPGTIHEGGELGYALAHAFGAVLDNPDLIAACVVGDGEAETGPLAASWRFNFFLNPRTSGAVLPIVHLNGYKLSGPALLARMTPDEIRQYFAGMGFAATIVDGEQNIDAVHAELWSALDFAGDRIHSIQQRYRGANPPGGGIPFWPVIVLRTEKGATGPHAGTFHSHGLPLANPASNPDEFAQLEEWLASYKPEQLFDAQSRPVQEVLGVLPPAHLRLGRNASANGGNCTIDLALPYGSHLRPVADPGGPRESATERAGRYLRDVIRLNEGTQNFRFFCPDETISNRLQAIFEATDRAFMGPLVESDEFLSAEGRVLEILSEHCCEGWLEGYITTGRHGVFACYESFISVADSMVHQYGKWLKMASETPWRKPTPSLNLLLSSHVWRQDHNGFSHQAPGFIDALLTSKPAITRAYFPPDANTLIATLEHCLQSRGYINVIVAGKNEMPQWLEPDAAREHCSRGLSRWEFASTDREGEADLVLACCGDVPANETIAAAKLLATHAPAVKVRVVNVTDLMRLAAPQAHPHGISQDEFEAIFPQHVPVVFAFHGYPHVVHSLLHGRTDADRFHVRGYMEEGTTTTPFDMLVRNGMSRFDLAALGAHFACETADAQAVGAYCGEKLKSHRSYIERYGIDMPEVR